MEEGSKNTPKTLPALLRRNAQRWGAAKVAIREKEFGIWQRWTWLDYFDQVRSLALGLLSLGFKEGNKLSIIGDNRPQWVMGELAAQALKGAAVGIFPDSHLEQVQYVVDHSDSTFVLAEDQEQTDKMLAILDQCPKIKNVIVDDMKGMRHYENTKLISMDDVIQMGKNAHEDSPDRFDQLVDSVQEEDSALIAYTSGTTGLPKGAILTHGNLIRTAQNFLSLDPLYNTDNHLSFLPIAWVGEQMSAISWHLLVGFTLNFPENVETVSQDIIDVSPNLIFAPPRFWEKICSDIQVKIQDAPWPMRMAYRIARPIGYRLVTFKLEGKDPGFFWKFLERFGHYIFFRPLKTYYGLVNLRNVFTGGAALGPEILNMILAMGIRIKQIYGLSETAGACISQREGFIKLNTIGEPIPEIEVKFSEEGEILIKGPSVFKGYYKNPEETRKALSPDGWLSTNDAGMLDEDGQIIMLDRMKDVVRLAAGHKLSPQLLQNKLKFSPYISEAVIIAKDRPFVSALISIDAATVGKWAEDRGLAYTTFTDLSQKEDVYHLIENEIKRCNAELPEVARVRRFLNLHKELDADDEELTRTKKIRRSFIESKYKDMIEALYGNEVVFEVSTDIRYSDGKEYRMKTTVEIQSVVD